MRFILSMLLCLGLLASMAGALPEIPKGMPVNEFYDGFYPTEEWVAQLAPLPFSDRRHPYQSVEIVAELPNDPKARWSGTTIRVTREDLDRMKRDMRRFLSVEPEAYLGLTPRRNRISGNSRVMLGKASIPCPLGDKGLLVWHPDDPDAITCNKGHKVDPFTLYPQTGVYEITGPLGEKQAYPYHDTPDGKKRIYLTGEFMDPLRVDALSTAAYKMGVLYAVTGDVEYAKRAAAIVCDFACAVKHWPKIGRGRRLPAHDKGRFLPISDFRVYGGIWYDKYHSGTGGIPRELAQAYDLIAKASVWDALNEVAGGDARSAIDRDLFLYTVQDAIRYDIKYPKPSSALSNYIPYQISGFLCIGQAAGMPELVHYAYWKEQQLARKTLMADGMFPESPSYARQHVYGMARAAKLAIGYSDPEGFISTIDGKRFENMDMLRDLPELRRAVAVLETLSYPNGENMMFHDTYGRLLSSGYPAPETTRPILYPSFGHAVLGRGTRTQGNQIQAHLHYSGNWGHGHLDMLNLILWAYKDELVSDIGYAHTYRNFADWTLGHNLVVVDRRYQERLQPHAGNLIAWHAPEEGPQVVEVSAPSAYKQCSVYRRTLFLLPLGERENLVLDIFDVQGGGIHEWMAQGSCMVDGALTISVPTESFAESYAADGLPFEPPDSARYAKEREAQKKNAWNLGPHEANPWYGVFRKMHRGRMDGPMEALFTYEQAGHPSLRLHMLQPAEADVYTCTVPSLRRCYSKATRREEHSLVEKYRMPKLIVRRDGKGLTSRFVALWAPVRKREERTVASVRNLAPQDGEFLAYEIKTTALAGDRKVRVYYSPDPERRFATSDGAEFQGRYAVVTRDADGVRAALYEGQWLKDGDCVLETRGRAALPLQRIVQTGENRFVVELAGVWDGFAGGVFHSPRYAILEQDGASRAFPVSAVEIADGATRLIASRHPGFTYDAARRVLQEVFTPFNSVKGAARVRLPLEVVMHSARSVTRN